MRNKNRLLKRLQLVQGEKGSYEYTADAVGESRVALFFSLVRDIPPAKLTELMNSCFNEEDFYVISDLFVLAFQTRDCRGGKGERDLFYKMYVRLYRNYPLTALKLMPLVAEYGSFKDYFLLLELISDGNFKEKDFVDPLRNRILTIAANQLKKDWVIYQNSVEWPPKISLCAKYAPREGKKLASNSLKKYFKILRDKIFPENPEKNKVLYRKMVVSLTEALDVPEVKMCGKRFCEIDFNTAPSLCVNKYRKAYLNIKLGRLAVCHNQETGNRHPTDGDRIECRRHFIKAIDGKKVHGKQLYPHEIIHQILTEPMSKLENDLCNLQWSSIRQQVLDKMLEHQSKEHEMNGISSDSLKRGVSVGRLVPMVDVSGSMSGTPLEVAVSLGILISEINHPKFRNRMLTFSANPCWIDLSGFDDISKKVKKTSTAEWGMNTDISKAFDQILDVVEKNKLKVEDIPDLIIFSDMQFDAAVIRHADGKKSNLGFETQFEKIQIKFAKIGTKICGEPYPMPKIIFWNLRGRTAGFPVQAYQGNVQMLSGFSPSLLKFVMDEGELDKKMSSGFKTENNPYDMLRKVLDDERYDPVRKVLGESKEGLLEFYSFSEKTEG